MARLGLKLLEIPDAEAERDLIVFVEADRCIADAVGMVTTCKMGRRRLKWMDYGKSAVSFLHTGKNKAVRIAAGKKFFPKPEDDINEFFSTISDNIFLTTMKCSDLIKLFEFIAAVPRGNGGWAQVSSEVRYMVEYYSSGRGALKDLAIHGKPVDPDADHTFATNDFLMSGGNGYRGMMKTLFNSVDTGVPLKVMVK